jgi:hypothetical protein
MPSKDRHRNNKLKVDQGDHNTTYRGSQEEPKSAPCKETQQEIEAMDPTEKSQHYQHRGSAGGIP